MLYPYIITYNPVTKIPSIVCLYQYIIFIFVIALVKKMVYLIVLLNDKNLIVYTTYKWLKKAFSNFCIEMRYLWFFLTKVELNYHLAIDAYWIISMYLGIDKSLIITRCIFKGIELKMRDGGYKKWEKRYNKILINSLFWVIKFNSVV